MSDVRKAVANALSNALENGYDFKGWSDDQIAEDLMQYDADIETMPWGQVMAAIKELRS